MTESEQELLRQFDLNPDFGPSIGEESSSSLDSTASVEATTCVKKFTNSSSYCVLCSWLHVPFSTAQSADMESHTTFNTLCHCLIAITYVCMMSVHSH